MADSDILLLSFDDDGEERFWPPLRSADIFQRDKSKIVNPNLNQFGTSMSKVAASSLKFGKHFKQEDLTEDQWTGFI